MLHVKIIFLTLVYFICFQASATEISFTMDDPEVTESPLFSVVERNHRILKAFSRHKIKGALFVCGMRIDNPEGKILLQNWDSNGHIIANHSYSHRYYHSTTLSFEDYKNDFLKVDSLINFYKNFTRLYRFPYLKEGDTVEKRDSMRNALREHGYNQGYVTIDASDWYVDARMRDRLKSDPQADLTAYKNFYLKHMWQRAVFYNDLSKKIFGREIKHTILIHHNLLNALFLNDLMDMFKNKGWNLISAGEAFTEPVFKSEPKILPAGESIVWALAKETGQYDNILRYPGEDGEYEKDEMDKLGL